MMKPQKRCSSTHQLWPIAGMHVDLMQMSLSCRLSCSAGMEAEDQLIHDYTASDVQQDCSALRKSGEVQLRYCLVARHRSDNPSRKSFANASIAG